ncbi:MAG: choloylglycine hydrolase family protein [Candidatus Margulisiibacteriota bacterium]
MMKTLVRLFTVLCLLYQASFACTDFAIKAKDGTVINGRSMEFPVDLKSELVAVPRGIEHRVVDAKGTAGAAWSSKYAFFGVNAFKLKDCFVEGLNEKGLSAGGLMFTGAVYQQPKAGKFVPLDKFITWILGNFASVDEVRAALPGITVCDSEVKDIKGMGLHLSLHDASGKSLVVEFIDGKMNIYDNPVGVLTNRPSFPWQLQNLSNYINLGPSDKKPRTISGAKVQPTGVGSGMLGLPGDWTPPSRFVRMVLCKDAALTPKNAKEAVVAAEHLLNAVDIPRGVIKENPKPFITLYGYAQWVVMKDLTNKTIYYKTYENTAWKKASLSGFKLEKGAPVRSIPMDSTVFSAQDVSKQFK